MVVVDGRVGYVGGSGIEDHYNDERFYDVMCRVEGPIVAQLQSVFLLSWRTSRRRAARGRVARCATSRRPSWRSRRTPRSGPRRRSSGTCRGPATTRSATPSNGRSRTPPTQIHIVNPYISNRAILERLLAAALRGVRVRLIAPGKPTPPYPAAAFRHWYGRLIDAGVEILLHPEMAHAKVLRIDDEVLIGGCNLDDLSLFRNDELDLRFDDPAVAELTERDASSTSWRRCPRRPNDTDGAEGPRLERDDEPYLPFSVVPLGARGVRSVTEDRCTHGPGKRHRGVTAGNERLMKGVST